MINSTVESAKILVYPDYRLLQKTNKITNYNDELLQLSEIMIKTMHFYDGIGLAAPQIGVNQAVFVMHLREEVKRYTIKEEPFFNKPLVFTNPKIITSQGSIVYEEGCLSLPEIREEITRNKKIEVIYQNLKGNERLLTAENLAAVCIQHEIDHLNGLLFFHRLNSIKRKFFLSKYKKQLTKQEI